MSTGTAFGCKDKERIGVNPEDDRLMTLTHEYLAAHPDPTTDEPGVGNL